MKLGDLDTRIRIEQRVVPNAPAADDAGAQEWELFGNAWAQVQDVLPSRGERVADGVTLSNRPARIRMRFRSEINSDMRIVIGSRILQIVAGPAMLGRREWLELMAEEYSSAGNPA